ncbi:MAG: orotidine-5'-phosphate decarboxylase [Anaerolineae bacterium]|nr:orotidine-5'-phosphate decarboxylase [Anaerolineae bacterium]
MVAKFNQRADIVNSLLCVGLDCAIERIPEPYCESATPQFDFNRYIIEQTHAFTAAYKPNIAFYEARGEQGWHELKLTIDYLRAEHPEIFTICDAKRGDIGSTSEAYATAIFDELGFDAVTLQPYLGREALSPFLQREDKACIILCRTSNPGAGELQDLQVEGVPLWQKIAQQVAEDWNKNGNCMLVMGATYPDEMQQVRSLVGDMTFLVPGIGAQGGNVQQTVEAGLNRQDKGLIISSSRGIIFADDPAQAAKDLQNDINQHR